MKTILIAFAFCVMSVSAFAQGILNYPPRVNASQLTGIPASAIVAPGTDGHILYNSATTVAAATGLTTNGTGAFTATGAVQGGSLVVSNRATFGIVNTADARIVMSIGSGKLIIANSGGTSFAAFDSANSSLGVGVIAPLATLHVVGTGATAGVILPACNTSIALGAGTGGKLCYRATDQSVYVSDGAGSASPITMGTKVSNTALN